MTAKTNPTRFINRFYEWQSHPSNDAEAQSLIKTMATTPEHRHALLENLLEKIQQDPKNSALSEASLAPVETLFNHVWPRPSASSAFTPDDHQRVVDLLQTALKQDHTTLFDHVLRWVPDDHKLHVMGAVLQGALKHPDPTFTERLVNDLAFDPNFSRRFNRHADSLHLAMMDFKDISSRDASRRGTFSPKNVQMFLARSFERLNWEAPDESLPFLMSALSLNLLSPEVLRDPWVSDALFTAHGRDNITPVAEWLESASRYHQGTSAWWMAFETWRDLDTTFSERLKTLHFSKSRSYLHACLAWARSDNREPMPPTFYEHLSTLIDTSPDLLTQPDDRGETPAMAAYRHRNMTALRQLLDKPAVLKHALEHVDQSGNTLLDRIDHDFLDTTRPTPAMQGLLNVVLQRLDQPNLTAWRTRLDIKNSLTKQKRLLLEMDNMGHEAPPSVHESQPWRRLNLR